jgi:hypothetical protein
MPRCKATTKTGKPCRAHAGPEGLCLFHANPECVKRLGQLGGRKNRKWTGVDFPVPSHMTPVALCELEVQVIRLLLAGELQAREATAVARLCDSVHRLLPSVDLETRLARLEKQITQQESELASCDNSVPSGGAEMDADVTGEGLRQEQDAGETSSEAITAEEAEMDADVTGEVLRQEQDAGETSSEAITAEEAEIVAEGTYQEQPEEIETEYPLDGSSDEASENGEEAEGTSDESDEAIEP